MQLQHLTQWLVYDFIKIEFTVTYCTIMYHVVYRSSTHRHGAKHAVVTCRQLHFLSLNFVLLPKQYYFCKINVWFAFFYILLLLI